ncbi:hypothetical protein OF122_12265 [Pelagibacterium flavum]|uniref:Flp pilus-assembly TadG-like N-terminal domain-containing protein n=1 Tax=Pelagibacterium flavum TaxID=2984530 RepID=A0ABY6INE0_9HYPH|nr:hypothetical protein [Pelagibacterium sp. YIM 151497]UYQ70837.1 hypothetical protein OF122_12265 [Pelagibacterium sp. YIM 151497]
MFKINWTEAVGWSDAAMAATSALALLLSAIALFILLRTLRATREAVVQAEAATKVAEAALNETRTIGEAQTRAYVIVTSCDLQRPGAEQIPQARVHFRNEGITPAADVDILGTIIVADYPSQPNQPFVRTQEAKRTTGLSPGAAATHIISALKPISLAEYNAVMAGHSAIYVSAITSSIDVFGKLNRAQSVFVLTGQQIKTSDYKALPAPYGNIHQWGLPAADG